MVTLNSALSMAAGGAALLSLLVRMALTKNQPFVGTIILPKAKYPTPRTDRWV